MILKDVRSYSIKSSISYFLSILKLLGVVTKQPLKSKYISIYVYAILFKNLFFFFIIHNVSIKISNFKFQPSFRHSENLEGHLSHREWENQSTAVKWLMDSKYCHFINVKISYLKEFENLMLTEISMLHKDSGALVLFKMEIERNQRKMKPSIFTSMVNRNPPFSIDLYLRAQHSHRLSIGGHFSIRNVVRYHDNSDIKGNLPILIPISQELGENFFNGIKVVPDIRNFSADSSTQGASDTLLDENGNNLAKFIHKKAAKQDYE